jgi:hypothetical protein
MNYGICIDNNGVEITYIWMRLMESEVGQIYENPYFY